jgi:hypothetical protein
MSNLQNATLLLKTHEGCILSQNNAVLVWSNINLRTVLGDMYDKFDLFNLQLNSISQCIPTATLGVSDDVRNVTMNISGLPFINQTYSVKNGTNTSESILTTFKFNNTTGTVQIYNNNAILTFGKNQEQANIQINYKQVVDGNISVPTNPFPQMVFQFTIYGVESTKHDITKDRMFK